MSAKTNPPIHLITYNLRFHRAYEEVHQLVEGYNPDIVCIQECVVQNLDARIGNLELVAKTTVGVQGLAIYTRGERFKLIRQYAEVLPFSYYERVRPEARERLLVAELEDKKTGKRVVVGCFHATHLVATNYHRRKQITHTVDILDRLHADSPIILAGDYNYPVFQTRLIRFMENHRLQLVIPTEYTHRNRVSHGKFDLAASRNVRSITVETLPQNGSDHRPVLVVTEV